MSSASHPFIPAMGRHSALPFYDPLLRLIGGDRVRRLIVEGAGIQTAQAALDIGCGTGSLLLQLKRQHPDLTITGIDPDVEALRMASNKAARAGLSVKLDQGFCYDLPYPDGPFDHVFSSYMFHHLSRSQQEETVRQVLRVLKPGGTFHLLDFEAAGVFAHGLLGLVHRHHGSQSRQQQLLPLLQRSGFSTAREVRRSRVLIQPVVLYRATK